MKRGPQEMELRYVTDFGEIGAGQVVEFVPREKTVPIFVPKDSPTDAVFGRMTIRGISLENEDIYDGDYALVRNDITKKDIGRHTICAVYIRSTGELVAKKIEFGKNGDLVTLKSSHDDIKDLQYHKDDIEVRAIVFGIQRMPDEYGRFRRRKDENDIPF